MLNIKIRFVIIQKGIKNKKNMANHNDLGKLGEEIARNFLSEIGHKIKAVNWNFSNAEIDIISEEGTILVFTEVKSRQNITFGYPDEAITRKKEKMIYEAAAAYMDKINYEKEIRFDIVTVTMEPKLIVQHYKDAFFPIW